VVKKDLPRKKKARTSSEKEVTPKKDEKKKTK